MKFRKRTLDEIADMICGNEAAGPNFPYRTSSYITRFFRESDTDYEHDGSTRAYWVSNILEKILEGPSIDATTPPDEFIRIIATLMDQGDAQNEGANRSGALNKLNTSLQREGLEAYYAEDNNCYLRSIKTNTTIGLSANPHRPMSADELRRKELLTKYLNQASEDELIEEILLPLFRQLGFHRITAAGHKDKALEYGKDIWMRYVLPTQHTLYFGIQVKKGKLVSAGKPNGSNSNIGEILNQISMMIGHEIFDPEVGRRVLVDHVFIIAGGEITKAARNWIGERLDAQRRSQIMFIECEDILNLFVVTNTPLPKMALPDDPLSSDEIPF